MSGPGAAIRITSEASTPTPLSDEHRRELEVESGISPEVIAARGYYTARSPRDLPAAFPTWQRRPGLVVPGLSPSGERIVQYKPGKPIRRKSGPGPKYETPQDAGIALDCNPLMLEEVRSGTGELWISEGAKKIDALASWGIPAVGLTGVYMAAVPGTKGTVPLPDWEHVRVKGRTVIIAFDADAKTNANVQEALRRLVAMLEGMGAVVQVVYVPAVDDDTRSGVDDYKAAGLTFEGLRRRAQPYTPLDVGRERMKRDGKLARVVRACRRRLEEMPANGRAACSNRAVYRDLLRAGERSGKRTPGGLLVVRSSLDGAVGARIGERAWWIAISRLEAAGELRRAKWGPGRDRSGAYLLTPSPGGSAFRAHYWREDGAREGQEGEGENDNPLSFAAHDRSVHETRAPAPPKVPALRWPKVVHTWGYRKGRRVVVDSDYVARIGKQGEEVIRYLLERGPASVEELLGEFGSKTARARDFARRRLKPLEDRGIIIAPGEDVELTPAWREALERAREEGDEPADNLLQAERVERRKLERREHFERVRRGEIPKADKTPPLRGKERNAEALERHREHWRREAERERRELVRPAETFAAEVLERLGSVRLELLEDMWTERGGLRRHLRIALRNLRCKAKRHAEHGGELFVYPPPPGTSPAVVPLRPAVDAVATQKREGPVEHATEPRAAERRDIPTLKKEPRKVNGVHIHGPDCACWLCEDEPSYAGAGGRV